MKRMICAVSALVCALVLSSCSLFETPPSEEQVWLVEQMQKAEGWPRIHAAEALLAADLERELVVETFRAELEKPVTDVPWRVGCLRVVYRGTDEPEEKQKVREEIGAIASDAASPGTTHAVETLLRLRVDLTAAEKEAIKAYVAVKAPADAEKVADKAPADGEKVAAKDAADTEKAADKAPADAEKEKVNDLRRDYAVALLAAEGDVELRKEMLARLNADNVVAAYGYYFFGGLTPEELAALWNYFSDTKRPAARRADVFRTLAAFSRYNRALHSQLLQMFAAGDPDALHSLLGTAGDFHYVGDTRILQNYWHTKSLPLSTRIAAAAALLQIKANL